MAMLDIAFLAPRLPWPLDTGGKIRTFHILAGLARHHRVTLLSFEGEEVASGGLERMRRLGVRCELFPRPGRIGRALQVAAGLAGPLPYNLVKYQSPRLLDRLKFLGTKGLVQMVHCDHLHMAPYGPASGLPFVVDEHNVETVIWRRFARDIAEPMARRALFAQQAFHLGRSEKNLCRAADLVLLCSHSDREALDRLTGQPGPATRVVPNGVDVAYFSAEVEGVRAEHVFFTGSMDWAPNENAVLTFLQEIWPVMQRSMPDQEFVVVGRNPGKALQEAAHSSPGAVHVTGTVPDVRPHMKGALALLVPMRVGGGTRLKILEAFAAGVPVISTAVGIEGIAAVPGEHYLRAETAAQFAEAAESLRRNPGLGNELVGAGVELVKARYSWDAIGDDLAEEYRSRFGAAPTGSC